MSKRIFDISISLLAILLLSVAFVLLMIAVRVKLGSPIFFRQNRPGLKEKIFQMYKFRTMTDERNPDGSLKEDHIRLTKFGRMLRATSLDELPGLWNVLNGDMSLVGPRPLLVEYLPLYSSEQARRHLVRPGITGWAQVNGRNAISWDEKFKLDVWYVDNQSIWLDIKILFLTCKKVFLRSDISADDHVTMPKFKGNSQ